MRGKTRSIKWLKSQPISSKPRSQPKNRFIYDYPQIKLGLNFYLSFLMNLKLFLID